MSDIRFGTDGWRAVIADAFTFDNVRLVAQAIAMYMHDAGVAERGLVIGYDNRFLSEKFAEVVAEVMAGNNISSWITVEATPTPVTAYAIKALGAGGAVMITASHNPPEYNGIKFIPEYAGPAVPEITGAIENKIALVRGSEDVRVLSVKKARDEGIVRDLDPKPGYIEHLRKLLDIGAVCRGNLRVVIDPMWGAGIGYVEELLRGGCSSLEIIHNYRDVLCGGGIPEPTAAELSELRDAVLAARADLGLALDGDADRFGVIDRDGSYITPNEILYLLLHYLLEYRRWRGPVARTVATTHMIDRIAEDYGLPVVETPVGFKYIGQSLLLQHSILGGEESGGLSIQGHIPEKDGILALALIVEMVASTGKSLREYQAEITEKFGTLVGARLDLKCDPDRKKEVLNRLDKWEPDSIAGQKVVKRNTADGVKVVLEDGSWVLVRPSGTEPLFRIYVEAPDNERLRIIQDLTRKNLEL